MQVQASPSKSEPQTLLRMPQVEARVGLKRSTIYEMLGRTPPDFPRPLKLSRRAVCWTSSAIDSWISERIQTGSES